MLNLMTIDTDLTTPANAGQIANQVAAKSAFADYRSRKAANTIKRQDADLALFAAYLEEVGAAVECLDIAVNPECWRGLTWGLVEGFVKWQLNQGFAVGSINVRLSTVKSYAKLAVKAGALDEREYAMIRIVSGYSRKEAKHIGCVSEIVSTDVPKNLSPRYETHKTCRVCAELVGIDAKLKLTKGFSGAFPDNLSRWLDSMTPTLRLKSGFSSTPRQFVLMDGLFAPKKH